MPLDARARKFLGDGPVTTKAAVHSQFAEKRVADYREREIITLSGRFYEEMLGFWLEQRRRHEYDDEVAIAALALLTINLREAYGQPQNAEEKKNWTPAQRDAKLEQFDKICSAMQDYYDEHRDSEA